MVNKKNQEKIKNYYQALLKVQPSYGKDIGLILIDKEETLSDLISLTPKSNQTVIFELSKDTYAPRFIKNLSEALKENKMIFVRIHYYLDPGIYNQFYLIYKSGKIDFLGVEEDIIFDVSQKSSLILVSTNEEIEKLNYKNLLQITGPTLRL